MTVTVRDNTYANMVLSLTIGVEENRGDKEEGNRHHEGTPEKQRAGRRERDGSPAEAVRGT